MKVLTFCSYFEPEIAASMYLTVDIFEGAANSGMEVELFAPTPTRGVDKETIKKYKKIKLEKRCNDKLKIHRFWMMQEGKGTIGRALRYILLNMAFVLKGLFVKADVMFIDSTPPTQGVLAALLKKIKKIPIVYNLQDVFPDSLVHTGICTEKSIFYKIGLWMEKVTYKNADKIIAISQDFKDILLKKGVPESKIEVVYNWVDENAVHKVDRSDNELFDTYKLDRSKFYVAYSGNVGLTQNMDLLVTVAQHFKENDEIGFVIVGDGAYKEELKKQIEEKHIKNITLIPFQPYSEIAKVFSLGDVGLIISKAGVGTNSVPSKTWSYMAAETPVLTSFDLDSELVEIVQDNQCGISIPPDDCIALIEAIENMSVCDLDSKGKKGREYIEKNLSKDVCVKKYIKTMEAVVN